MKKDHFRILMREDCFAIQITANSFVILILESIFERFLLCVESVLDFAFLPVIQGNGETDIFSVFLAIERKSSYSFPWFFL